MQGKAVQPVSNEAWCIGRRYKANGSEQWFIGFGDIGQERWGSWLHRAFYPQREEAEAVAQSIISWTVSVEMLIVKVTRRPYAKKQTGDAKACPPEEPSRIAERCCRSGGSKRIMGCG